MTDEQSKTTVPTTLDLPARMLAHARLLAQPGESVETVLLDMIRAGLALSDRGPGITRADLNRAEAEVCANGR